MLNRVILQGRLTRDPEMRYTQTQKPVTSFTLAVERNRSSEKTTDFINCVAWNQGAEFVDRHFKKGQMVACEGRLQSRKWEDRDGNKRTEWEVVCDNVYFGGDKPKSPDVSASDFEELEDDSPLPFD